MEQSPGTEPRRDSRLVHSRAARMGFQFHGGDCPYPYGPGLSLWRLQVSAGTHLDHRCVSSADDTWHGLQRASASLRSRRLLGTWHRSVNRKPCPNFRSSDCQIDARWPDHCRRHAVPLLRSSCVRDSRDADRFRVSSSPYGAETGNQRMADAGTYREASDLRKRISSIDEEGWRAVRSLCRVEGSILRRIHPLGCRCMRCLLRSVRTDGPPGPDHYPDGAKT